MVVLCLVEAEAELAVVLLHQLPEEAVVLVVSLGLIQRVAVVLVVLVVARQLLGLLEPLEPMD